MKVDGFDWDSGNLLKNEAKHGLTREVIEAVFHGNVRVGPDPKHSNFGRTLFSIGRRSFWKIRDCCFHV